MIQLGRDGTGQVVVAEEQESQAGQLTQLGREAPVQFRECVIQSGHTLIGDRDAFPVGYGTIHTPIQRGSAGQFALEPQECFAIRHQTSRFRIWNRVRIGAG